MPSLASFEVLFRRLQTIVEAYSGAPQKAPDWSMAKFFGGVRSDADGICPELRHFAVRQAREEGDLQVGRNGRKNAETSYIQGAVDDVRVYQADLDQVAVEEIMKGDFALVAARRRIEGK